MTVSMLLHNADSRELSEWQAFFKIENEEMDKKMGKQKNVTPVDVNDKLKHAFGLAGAKAVTMVKKA
jgi:hypothetical protein